MKDTWRLIKSGRHFSYRDFEIQGSTPFHPRYAKCEGTFGCRPTVITQGCMERRVLKKGDRWQLVDISGILELPVGESLKESRPLILKETWCVIRSSRHLGYQDFEKRNENSQWENPQNTLRFIMTVHIKSNLAIDCGLSISTFRLPGL